MILHLRCPRVPIAALALPATLAGRSHCTISGRRKLPWHYPWPDAERYVEEVNLGLHSKGAKQAARAAKAGSTAGGQRRGRPPKASQAGDTEPIQAEQMGLGL